MEIKSEIAIVVVAYNRPKSLSRLLSSIAKAKYPSGEIPLIISIDKADNNEDVFKLANDFNWQYGEKTVNYEKANLGLRKHVIKCGNLSEVYGGVIILEDDLYVSPNFYLFAKQALNFSNDKNYIGGISLYNHKINVHTMDNFEPLEDGYDNWYFQFASSWGQAWSSTQWQKFRQWYDENEEKLLPNDKIPRNVTDWSDKSWLKFFIAYLIEKNMFFLYPKISLSSNFSDVGTHVGLDTTSYQVPLDYSEKYTKQFSTLIESNSVYDSFYENIKLSDCLNLKAVDLEVDLYSYKSSQKKYLLTTQILDFEIIKTFGRSLKPIDTNIIEDVKGRDIFLYNTNVQEKNPFKMNRYRKLIYNIKFISPGDGIMAYLKIKMDRIRLKFLK